MKNKVTNLLMSNLLIVATLTSLSSCKKDFSASPVSQSISTTNLVSVTTPLGIALNGYANSTTDSVYVLYGGDKTLFRDEIPVSVLPASIQQFQTDNYQDYSQINSFTLIDINGTVKSYLSVIRFNERPVALEFSTDGNLLTVLEQREKADLNNAGWHTGGLFENRDGSNRDNIDIATLPVDINDYFVNNYSQDIITRAFKTKEDAIVVLSKNNGVFANIFNKNLQWVKHMDLQTSNYQIDELEKSSVSPETLSVLSAMFPNYVFETASGLSDNGTNMGSIVCINANNTRYALNFDNNGNMQSTKVIY